MSLVKVDKKGRIYLPKDLREKFNVTEFYAVDVPEGILLIPLRDPIKVLEEEGKKLPNSPLNKLRKEALKEAEKEIGLR